MIRKILLFSLALAPLTALLQAEPPEWSSNPDEHITIKTLPGQMRYDVSNFEVEPGAKVKLTLVNDDDLQHNLVILQKQNGDPQGIEFAKEMWLMAEKGIELGWVKPDHERIIAATRLLNPHESEDIYFVAPDQGGEIPYVCTVPGHAMIMNGKIRVRSKTKLLSDVRYRLYEGTWDKLPDFSTLDVKKAGLVPSNLLDPQIVKKKGSYGLVFEGKLIVPKTEDYEFLLTSDDGSLLVIDGEGVVGYDGVHPAGSIKKKKIKLEEGHHTFQVRYFDKSGDKRLSIVANTKSMGAVPLTTWVANGQKAKKAQPDPIMLAPVNPGEAVLYRNFIQSSNPRGIGVGYPGNVNLCWDADTNNLALLWRGAFMDASKHWTNRGQGDQGPAGYDIFKTGQGLPLQVLDSPDEPWVEKPTATIKYGKDTTDPQQDKTFILHPEEYQFRGYRLDDKRFPTFRYTFQDLTVEDRFDPALIEEREAVVRTISIEGKPAKNTHFRLADSGSLEQTGGWYDIGNEAALKVEGADPFVRDAGGKELLVPITGDTELKVTYWWKTKIGGRTQ